LRAAEAAELNKMGKREGNIKKIQEKSDQ
jgi:hypothetical protein